jgi:hypothetical protein
MVKNSNKNIVGNMLLSKYINENEINWHQTNYKDLDILMKSICTETKIDLYAKCKMKNSVDLYNYNKIWLLAFHKKALYNGLKRINIDISQFEKEVIVGLILLITREREYKHIADVLVKEKIIKEIFIKENAHYIIQTIKYGDIYFSKADKQYLNGKLKKYAENKELLYKGICHKISFEIIEQNEELHAITGIATKYLCEKYYHTVCVDKSNKIIDLTGNFIMSETNFKVLYNFKELNRISYKELVRIEKESKNSDESGTLFPLLRIAVYKSLRNEGNSGKIDA